MRLTRGVSHRLEGFTAKLFEDWKIDMVDGSGFREARGRDVADDG
jgi:hypothetical protein